MPLSEPGEVALLVAGGGTQQLRLAELAGCTGVRMLGLVDYADLANRLSQQGHLDILWLCGEAVMDLSLVDKIASETERLGATIVCDLEGAALDAAFADFAHLRGTQFLSQADAIDCETALAAARGAAQTRVADSAAGHALERIDRLQEEVARISALLASLAERSPARHVPSGPVSFTPMVRASDRGYRAEPELQSFAGSAPARVDSATVRRMLRERRMREQFFAAELFADPAWDMLLDLYAAQLEGHPVAVSSLCIAAAVPATTALRWIKTMTDTGLLERQADPRDGRRIFIGLTGTATQAMDRYFAGLEGVR
jgi:DNA-binding MarR family transcriptional regulator